MSPAAGPGVQQLRSALVSDALDARGMRGQTLGADIRALTATGRSTVARALPVHTVRCEPADDPYRGLLATLDAIEPGSIVVVATGRSDCAAVWGELCQAACDAAGGVGAVTDGLIRDTAALRHMRAVVHCRGTVPVDISGRLVFTAPGDPVGIDGVAVAVGDVVVADDDGVVIVPAAIADEVLADAAAKAADENRFRDAVTAGMTPTQAYAEFGVL